MKLASALLLIAAAAVLGAAIQVNGNRILTEVALGLMVASVLTGMRSKP